MKFFLDTEFIESGRSKPLELISIGIVCGNSFIYMVSSEFREDDCSDWLKINVLPNLNCPPKDRLSIDVIAKNIITFVDSLSKSEKPEFWGYYCDYDWVVFCQLFGRMIDLPKGWPMYCRDIKQLCDFLGNPKLPKLTNKHNSLFDAKWNQDAYEFLRTFSYDRVNDLLLTK